MPIPPYIPTPDRTEETIDQLNELIAHHRATLEVCDAAAPRVDDIEVRGEIRDMVTDHLRHLDRLARCVEKLGGRPTRRKADLPHERDDVVDDNAEQPLLTVVLADEEVVAAAYQDVADEIDGSQTVERAVDRGLELIDKHRSWLRDEIRDSA